MEKETQKVRVVNKGGRPKAQIKRDCQLTVMCNIIEKKMIQANAFTYESLVYFSGISSLFKFANGADGSGAYQCIGVGFSEFPDFWIGRVRRSDRKLAQPPERVIQSGADDVSVFMFDSRLQCFEPVKV